MQGGQLKGAADRIRRQRCAFLARPPPPDPVGSLGAETLPHLACKSTQPRPEAMGARSRVCTRRFGRCKFRRSHSTERQRGRSSPPPMPPQPHITRRPRLPQLPLLPPEKRPRPLRSHAHSRASPRPPPPVRWRRQHGSTRPHVSTLPTSARASRTPFGPPPKCARRILFKHATEIHTRCITNAQPAATPCDAAMRARGRMHARALSSARATSTCRSLPSAPIHLITPRSLLFAAFSRRALFPPILKISALQWWSPGRPLPTFDFDFNRLIRDANLPDRTHRIPSRTAIPSARRARTIHKLSRSPGGAGCSRLTLGVHPRATSPRPPRRGLPPTVWLCP